jgi:hypothetical protein
MMYCRGSGVVGVATNSRNEFRKTAKLQREKRIQKNCKTLETNEFCALQWQEIILPPVDNRLAWFAIPHLRFTAHKEIQKNSLHVELFWQLEL